jgi:hypothetical protein
MGEHSVRGELRVLQALNPYEFGVVLTIMRSGENRNKWDYRNVEEFYRTFAGTPILVAYTMGGSRIGDGHNMAMRVDPKTGEKYWSFTDGTAERIVGTISEDPEDITLVERDGETWIEAKGRIFRFYARELVDKIIEAGTMEVSAETEVHEEYENEQGVTVFERWTALGVTILGDGVAPAIPGARIAALQSMQEEFTALTLRAASLREGKAPSDTVPEGKENTPPDEPADEDGGVKNNSDKGVNKRMNFFNKTQLAALADKFTGWIVVCAAKDDDGIHVGLRNDKAECARYTMLSETDTFAPERVEKVAVCADFGGGLTADVGDMLADCAAQLATNAALLESVTAERDAHAETIRTMQERESAWQKAEAKRTARTTLNAFNANREEKVAESVLEAVDKDIDDGLCVNAEDVAMRVKALCADQVAAQDKRTAEQNRRSYIWESARVNAAEGDDGSLKSLLARMNME